MKVFIALLIAVISLDISAQILGGGEQLNNRFYLEAGIDPASLATLGFVRKVKIQERKFYFFSEISSVVSYPGLNHSELKSGAMLPIVEVGKLKILTSPAISAGYLETGNFNSTKFALSNKLVVGVYGKRLFAGGIIEYQHMVLNHLTSSAYYRETYYDTPRDGWYKGGGGAFEFGIEGGVTFGKRIDVYFEIKMPFTEKLNLYSGSPFHVIFGIAYKM